MQLKLEHEQQLQRAKQELAEVQKEQASKETRKTSAKEKIGLSDSDSDDDDENKQNKQLEVMYACELCGKQKYDKSVESKEESKLVVVERRESGKLHDLQKAVKAGPPTPVPRRKNSYTMR